MDYFEFLQALREAERANAVIQPTDQERWEAYVAAHTINQVAALAIGRGRMTDPAALILEVPADRQGLYIYSENDEVCLRLVFQD
ncbi:MAG TPA: hypothetical protein VEL28_18725 [Candidatus Binatia bacterium]|nr:hypothetical protein [Candidatus Binatia bacterium]